MGGRGLFLIFLPALALGLAGCVSEAIDHAGDRAEKVAAKLDGTVTRAVADLGTRFDATVQKGIAGVGAETQKAIAALGDRFDRSIGEVTRPGGVLPRLEAITADLVTKLGQVQVSDRVFIAALAVVALGLLYFLLRNRGRLTKKEIGELRARLNEGRVVEAYHERPGESRR